MTRLLLALACALSSAVTVAQDTLVDQTGRLRLVQVVRETADSVIYYDLDAGAPRERRSIAQDAVYGIGFADTPGREEMIKRSAVLARERADTMLRLRDGFFVTRYYVGKDRLGGPEVLARLGEGSPAGEQFRRGRSIQVWSQVLAIPSGFVLGYQLANVLRSDRSANVPLVIAGGAGAVLSGVLYKVGQRRHSRALDEYRERRLPGTGWVPADRGLGIALVF